jgi:lipopolysaccharide transport system permease protein
VPESYRNYLAINPMTGLVESFRSAILGRPISWELLGISAIAAIILLGAGMMIFRKMESKFADLI